MNLIEGTAVFLIGMALVVALAVSGTRQPAPVVTPASCSDIVVEAYR